MERDIILERHQKEPGCKRRVLFYIFTPWYPLKQVILLRNSVESDHLLSDAPAQQDQAFPTDYTMAAALSDADLANLLMSSPLYRKLGEIKRTMEDGTLPQRKRGEGACSPINFERTFRQWHFL